MKPSCLLVTICMCIAAVHAVSFQGNVSANIVVQNGWEFRATATDTFNTGLLKLLSYVSVATDGSTSSNAGSYNVSGIAGAGIFADTQIPYSFLAAFAAQSTWNVGPLQYFLNLNVAAAAGYIATAYVRLEEKMPNGTVVASQPLTVAKFGLINGLVYTQDYTQNDGTLSSVSYVGRPQQGSWYINFTFVASSVIGVINVADAVVGPSSLETLVQIYNWPYQSSQNFLSMVMLTVSGGGSASAGADATIVSSGSGNTQVYFQASATAEVDGTIAGVKVQAAAAASYDGYLTGNEFLLKQIAQAYAGVSLTAVSVDFPANAKNIAYDPSVGSGKPLPSSSGNSAASVVISVSVVVLALFASLL